MMMMQVAALCDRWSVRARGAALSRDRGTPHGWAQAAGSADELTTTASLIKPYAPSPLLLDSSPLCLLLNKQPARVMV